MQVTFPIHDIAKLNAREGFERHCDVAALIIRNFKIDPHTKHHIRTAIREATHKVTEKKGDRKSTAHFISEKALAQIQDGNFNDLVLEHVVPISHINECVLNYAKQNGTITSCHIQKIILDLTCLAVITEAEDGLLTKKTMPSDEKFSRYTSAGITLVDNQYRAIKDGFSKKMPGNKMAKVANNSSAGSNR